MYCSQSKNGQGDFASIAIKDGRVEFRFDTGSGPAIIKSGVPINAGAWYTVYIERKLREDLTTPPAFATNKRKNVSAGPGPYKKDPDAKERRRAGGGGRRPLR